jgi:hypothetical protein
MIKEFFHEVYILLIYGPFFLKEILNMQIQWLSSPQDLECDHECSQGE